VTDASAHPHSQSHIEIAEAAMSNTGRVTDLVSRRALSGFHRKNQRLVSFLIVG
jgi:hypothetical protein